MADIFELNNPYKDCYFESEILNDFFSYASWRKNGIFFKEEDFKNVIQEIFELQQKEFFVVENEDENQAVFFCYKKYICLAMFRYEKMQNATLWKIGFGKARWLTDEQLQSIEEAILKKGVL